MGLFGDIIGVVLSGNPLPVKGFQAYASYEKDLAQKDAKAVKRLAERIALTQQGIDVIEFFNSTKPPPPISALTAAATPPGPRRPPALAIAAGALAVAWLVIRGRH